MEIVIIEKEAFEAFMAEVSRLLRLSPRTLQGMRDRNLVACSQVGRKFYYRTEDVERLVSEKREGTP